MSDIGYPIGFAIALFFLVATGLYTKEQSHISLHRLLHWFSG